MFEEIKKQLWLAGPLISVNVLLLFVQMISLMFVGHLGELPLSGASMATSFASVTGLSLLVSRLFPHPLSVKGWDILSCSQLHVFTCVMMHEKPY